MSNHHNFHQIYGISHTDFLETVCSKFLQTISYIFWYMLCTSLIAGVNFKIRFGLAKIIEFLIEDFLRICV